MMDFTALSNEALQLRVQTEKPVFARRTFWAKRISVMMDWGPGTPTPVVAADNSNPTTDFLARGLTQPSVYLCFHLCVDGKPSVYFWCPSVDDVLAQDWVFV